MRNYTVLKGLQASAALAAALLVACAAPSGQRSSANMSVSADPPAPAPARPAEGTAGFRGFPSYPADSGVSAAGAGTVRPAASSAATPQVRQDAPLRYVVKPGDTLWGIAQKFLIEPWQWPEVWVINEQIRNPHRIYPGDVLTLIWRDGRPQVEVDVTETDRLSPRIRYSDVEAAIPTIPMEAIRDFLRSPRVVSLDQLANAPYLLDFANLNILGAAGHGAYARKLQGPETVWEVVRLGTRYVDPDTKELLGHEAIPVAEAALERYGDPGTVVLTRSYREVRAGDYLLKPELESFMPHFQPRAPTQQVSGHILSVFDGVTNIGQYQVVAISKGRRDGLAPGHVLDIVQAGRSAKDPHGGKYLALPEVYAGQLMVFKVDERLSYALVTSVIRPVHVLDKVMNPAGRSALH